MFFPSFSAARTTLESPIPVRRTKRLLRVTGMVLGMVLLALAPSYVQKGGQAGIQGTVTDNTGAVIPDAAVTATNNATGPHRCGRRQVRVCIPSPRFFLALTRSW
ncbi:MAG: carboxypeptidase-like regulatory domain-containing protein [Granulicella sp.]